MISASLPVISCLLLASIANAAVTISPAHPELLQQGIVDAYNGGQKSVVIPAGVYQVPSVSGRHLEFDGMNNFEIDATGVTLVLQDVTASGINFYNCNGVYFHGATVYYATPPFSQGVVQAVASDGSSFDVQIEQGYPTNLDDSKYFSPGLAGHLFDSATRLWKRNVYDDFYGTSTQRLGTDTFRIFTTYFDGAAGDLVGIRPGTGDNLIKVISSSLMRLSGLTILNAAEFGILEAFGAGGGANTYSNITITRGSAPAGAATNPLFSTSADGFHSISARTGPYVTGCSFAFMADDGMAVHGVYSWVMESSGNTLIVSDSATGAANFQVGDTLQLSDTNDDPADSATVTGVTLIQSYTNAMKSARPSVRDFTVGPYYQITLDSNVTAGFDYLAGNPNASGAGFVLLNNAISNNRGRGIIVKAATGTIQENVIDGSMLGGIKVGPDFWWGEAGEVSKLVIRGNTINNVSFSGVAFAGLMITPDPVPASPGTIIRNITVDSNTFSNFDVPAIFITSASGVTVTNNVFTNLQNALPFNPDYVGQNVLDGTLVFVTRSTGVEFQGNTVSQSGRVNAWFAEALPGSGVSGAAYVTPVASSDTDFSGTQGASNWNYGYFPSGNANAFTMLPVFDTTNARWQHTTFGPPWTALWSYSGFFPNPSDSGTEEWATRRWMSNFTGPAAITGHLVKTDTGANSTGIFGMIYLNQALVYKHFIQGTDGTGIDYSVNVQLHKGDTVDFAVAPNGAEGFDNNTQFTSSILSITLVNQAIAFTPPPNVTVTTLPFSLSATSDSGLAVSFSSNTPGVCTVSGSTVTVVAGGGCSITASQAGNAAYAAAAPVTVTFTVLFTDVASTDYYYAAIIALAQHGITAGCGNNGYCPQQNVTRDEMAIFMVRAVFGGDNFTYSTTPYFTDVQPTTFGFKWIQKLKELGITSGCGTGIYCPTQVVTRDQMAVFIERIRLGVSLAGSSSNFTYPTTPLFTDTASDFAFPWIQRLKQDGITGGCGGGTTYCPGSAVIRGDMAIFIMRGAFNRFLPAGTPVIGQISPSALALGTSGTFTITGANTSFVQGTTQLGPIPGVTIGTITVTSATSLTVQLTAAANAVAQPYSILATTGSEQDVLPNGLVLQ
jgi:hypothetical protein